MPEVQTSELNPTGLALFTDAETFLTDLSEEHESMISGGGTSISRSDLVRRRRQRRRRRVRLRRIRIRIRIRVRRRRIRRRRRNRSTT
ncbi:hypothetical protein [Vacuolonema iberomarrocanum]|uniref:hypothetical protein n=1 Tax=Vacuolonema iberomarrocanum TaxID=3454632 RepID=UPI0019F18C59|nr:hypothetical protein [filamentous cyanobacterium LEGE 07170]